MRGTDGSGISSDLLTEIGELALVPATGAHRIVVKNGPKSWQRNLQVNGGSTISLNAVLQ